MWRRVWIYERTGVRGPLFAVRWYDDGRKVRTESCGSSKRRAEDLRRLRESELNAGLLRSVEPIRLAAFVEEHLALIASQVQPGTTADQKIVLRHFARHVGDVRLERIGPRTIEGYVSARAAQVRPATVNREIRTLRSVFARAQGRGYVRANPFATVRLLREPERSLRVLSAVEAQALLEACRTDAWRAFVFLALTTGCRRGELAALRWEDVDFEAGVLSVRCSEHHRTKSAKNRLVSLVPAAARMLLGLKRATQGDVPWVFATNRGTRWGNGTLRGFRRIVADAGIPACTLHDLRRTFCSHLAMLGVNEAVVQELAGHASMETTRRHYQRILPEALRAAPARLPWADFKVVSESYRKETGVGKRQTA